MTKVSVAKINRMLFFCPQTPENEGLLKLVGFTS
jgi:hypothetical protein